MSTDTSTPTFLTADQILGVADVEERIVVVPEWQGAVRVRGFTKRQQHEFRRASRLPNGELDDQRLEMLMFVHGVIEPKFAPDQLELLRDKAAAAIDRILREIADISGLNQEVVKEAKRTFPPES